MKPIIQRFSRGHYDAQQAVARLENGPWRRWHEHLYSCRACGSGKRCADGEALLRAAEHQPGGSK